MQQIDNTVPFQTLTKFLAAVGVSRTTGYRWRQLGWLKCVPVAGRPYVTREAVNDFLKRASAGGLSEITMAGSSSKSSRQQR
jgi:predicted site-specific integrase-resolvase